MKRYVLRVFLFACFFFACRVFAQQYKATPVIKLPEKYVKGSVMDSLYSVLKIAKEDTNKVITLNKLSSKYEMQGSLDTALLSAESAQALAENIGFKKGMANAFLNIGNIYRAQSNYQKALEYYLKSFNTYQSIGNKKEIAKSLGMIGVIYYAFGNYSISLEYYFKVLTTARQIKDSITMSGVLCNIGLIYGDQGNYPKSLEYLFQSLEIKIKKGGNEDGIAIVLGNIGNIYLLRGDYNNALEYSLKAVTQAQEVGDKASTANFLDNIGNIYYKQGNYTLAMEYEFNAATIAHKIGNIDELAMLYSDIGKVYMGLKNYKEAKILLDTALNLSEKIGNKKDIETVYSDRATLDSAMANYKTAYDDYKQYVAYRDSIVNQKTTQIEMSYEFEKREDSIRAEYEKENIIKTAEINKKKILTDSALAIVALTILLAILLINRQQIKRKKDKLFFENELANAKTILEDYVKNMAEKNKLLEQFKIDLENMEKLKAKEIDENRIERLNDLNKTTILTEEDWDKFKELFEQAYKGFFIRLKEKLPDITQAEIRLICLIKLKLNAKEMSGILGVSSATIKQTRYRLRKKLDLPEGNGIDEMVESI